MPNFVKNIRKTVKTDIIEQKIVRPLVDSTKDRKNGSRSTGYGISDEIIIPQDGSYDFGDIIDGRREPKLPKETLGTLTGCVDKDNPDLRLILKPNGILEDLEEDSGEPVFYYTSNASISGYFSYTLDISDLYHASWAFPTKYCSTTVYDAFIVSDYILGEHPSFTYTLIRALAPVDTSAPEWSGWPSETPLYDMIYNRTILDVTVPVQVFIWGLRSGFTPDRWTNNEQFTVHDVEVLPYVFGTTDNHAGGVYGPEFDPNTTLQLYRNQNDHLWRPDPSFPSIPLNYRYPLSVIELKFGSDRTGIVAPTKVGGIVLYEKSGGSPTGYARVYKPNRTLDRIIPAAQVFSVLP